MSREIDERIVQMRFDAGSFNRDVQTSIHNLDELKRGLDFQNSVKGFEKIDRVAKDTNLVGLGAAVDTVKMKFSALEVVALTALQRMTNSAITTGKQLVSSLSTDQINAGWDKFAQKTTSVQTIMAATASQFADTGVQMEYVTQQLDKLNWFTDETSYNFVDMVNNIGKFTSNNIALEDSVTAMQGIANWAAISGANANEASRAMYNISQAMATGKMALIDWKSIENANMATAEFKKTALETAVQLGTLEKVGENTFRVIGTKTEIAADTFQGFNDSLQKGWFSKDVLMTTLDRYGKATNKLNDLYEELGESVESITTSQIVSSIDDYVNAMEKARKESEENGDSAEVMAEKSREAGDKVAESVAKDWNIPVERAKEILAEFEDETMQFGLKAFKAAQEAKTFADAIDSVKDAVSTGWMKSFEYLFGNYQEAKEFWTEIANTLYNMFALSGEARNEMLADWKEMGGREYFIDSIYGVLSAINRILIPIKTGMQEAFGGPMTGAGLFELTKKLHEFIGNLILTEENMDKLQRTARGLFSILDIGKTLIFGAISKAFKLLGALSGDASLDILGFTANIGDVLYNFRNLVHESTILNDAIDNLIDGIVKGKEVLTGFAKAFYEFPAVQAVIKTFGAIFSDFGGVIKTVTSAVKEFYEKVKDGPKITSWKDLLNIFEQFKDFMKDQLGTLADMFPNTTKILGKAFEFLSGKVYLLNDPLKILGGIIKNLFASFGELAGGITAVDLAIIALGVSIFGTLWQARKMFSAIVEGIELFTGGFKGMGKLLTKFVKAQQLKAFATSLLMVAIALKVLSTIDTEKIWETGIALVAISGGLIGLSVAMGKVKGGKLSSAAFLALGAGILAIALALNAIDVGTGDPESSGNALLEKMKVLGVIIGALAAIAIVLSKAAPQMSTSAIALISFAASVHLMIMAVNRMAGMDIETLKKGLPALIALMASLGLSVRLTGQVEKATISILAFAVAANLLIGAVKKLGKLRPDQLVKGVVSLGVLMTELAIAMRIMGSLRGGALKVGGSILALSVGINLLIPALKELAKLDDETIEKGRNALWGLGAIFVAAIAVSAIAGSNSHKAGLMLIEMAGAITLLVVAVRALGLIDDKQLLKGVLAVDAIGAIFVAAIWASRNTEEAKGTMIAITAALVVLAYSVYELSKIEWKKLLAASLSLGGVILAFGGAVKLISGAEFSKDTVADVAVMIAITAAVAYLLTEMAKLDNIEKTIWVAGAIGVLLLSLSGSMKIMSGTEAVDKDVLINIGVMAGIAVAIGGLIALMAHYIPEPSIKTALTIVGAIAILMPILSACFVGMTKFSGEIKKGMAKQFVAMTAIITVLGAAIVAVTAIPGSDVDGAVKIMKQLYILIPILTLVFIAISKIPRAPSKTMMKRFAEFSGIITAFGILIGVAAAVPMRDINQAIKLTQALDIFVPILSACFVALSLVKRSPSKATMLAFTEFAAIVTVIGAAITSIAYLPEGDFDRAMKVVLAIDALIPVMAACFTAMSLLNGGKMGIKDTLVFGVFAVIASAVGGLVSYLASQADLDYGATMDFVKVLWALIPMLAGVTAVFSKIKTDVKSVLAAGAMIDALGIIIGAFLLLVGKIPAEDLVAAAEKGRLLGDAIGGFFGSIISGLIGGALEGIASTLPAIGGYLTDFWDRSKPFFDGIKSIDGATLEAVGIMTAALIALTAAEFVAVLGIIPGVINTVADALGIGPTLPEKFQKFGQAIAAFAKELDGVDADKVKAAAEATKILGDLEKNLPAIGGPLEKFLGKKDLADFGSRLSDFGGYLADFAEKTKDVTAEKVQGAADAGKLLAELEESLPAQGGKLQGWLGRQDLGAFGARLNTFGFYIVQFADKVKDVKKSQVEGAYNAGKLMSDLENSLPYTGGTVTTWFFGEQNLASFGLRLTQFGSALATYVGLVEGITAEKTQGSKEAVEALVDLEKNLDTTGGLGAIFFGDSSFTSFAKNLTDLGQALYDYGQKIAMTDLDAINNVTAGLEALISLGDEVKASAGWAEDLVHKVGSLINILLTSIDAQESEIKRRGKDIIKWVVEGLKQGVNEQTNFAKKTAKDLANLINDQFRATLEIASPSAVMEENGKWIVRGIAEGIKKDTSAEEAIEQKAKNIESAFQSALDGIDLTYKTVDVDFRLWSVSEGLTASDEEYAARQAQVEMAKLESLADTAANKKAVMQAMLQEFGETSKQFIEASNNYKEALISMYEQKNSIDQAAGTVVQNGNDTIKSYAAYMKEAAGFADMLGWTQEQMEDYAAKKSGYDIGKVRYEQVIKENEQAFEMLGKSRDELETFAREKTGYSLEKASSDIVTTADIIQRALADQEVTIEKAVTSSIGGAIKKGAAEANTEGLGKDAGNNLMDGLGSAIEEKTGISVTKYRKSLDAIWNGGNEEIDAHSPSKKTYLTGTWLMQGLQNGIRDHTSPAVDEASNAARNIMGGLIQGFADVTPEIETSAISVTATAISALNDRTNVKLAETAGANIGQSFGSGLVSKVTSMLESMKKTVSTTLSKITSSINSAMSSASKTTTTSATSVGQNAGKGLAQGMASTAGEVAKTAGNVAAGVTKEMASMLKVKSPSRVTMEIGNYVGLGLAKGIADSAPYVNEATEDLTANMTSSLDYAAQAVDAILQSDDDYEPVITPVLDLDQLKKDANNIPGYLNSKNAISLNSAQLRVGQIAAARAELENQNGSKVAPTVVNNYDMTQNNYSPKALNRVEIYRQTRNQFSRLKGATKV